MVHHQPIALTKKQADAYVIGLGPLNLVFASTDTGLVGCGAFDVKALERFNYPAARIAGPEGRPIASVTDLLAGAVKEANAQALERGIAVGMACRDALERL